MNQTANQKRSGFLETGKWDRVHAATGIAFVAINVFVLVRLPLPPAVGAPTSEMVTYFADHGDLFLVMIYLALLSCVPFLWFVGFLGHVLNRAETHPRPNSAIVLHAGSVWAAIALSMGALGQAMPSRCTDSPDLNVVRAVSDMMNYGGAGIYIPAALLVGAASVSILRIAVLPRWVGVLGLVIMVLEILGSLSLAVRSGFLAAWGPFGVSAYAGFLVWILVVSIVLVVKPVHSPARAPA